jgi:hypothetical protein
LPKPWRNHRKPHKAGWTGMATITFSADAPYLPFVFERLLKDYGQDVSRSVEVCFHDVDVNKIHEINPGPIVFTRPRQHSLLQIKMIAEMTFISKSGLKCRSFF